MSNRICQKCKSTNVVEDGTYGGTTYYRCETCHHLGEKDDFPEMTVFDRITASPEVLAPEFVYCEEVFPGWDTWCSLLLGNVGYRTKQEAIAATVARLKEVER